jgi:NAD dependent epimerase/dehydratase
LLKKWEDVPVLITGAGGFIASHLAERLVREGARVRAFVHYNSRGDWGLLNDLPPDLLAEIEVVAGDLRDSEAVRAAMRGVETVFHLGALISIPYSYRNPREVVETNLMGTLNVLLAARDLKPQSVVHTSSSEVYGTAQYTPIDEQHPVRGQSPYAASKIGADQIAQSFYLSYDVPVVILRPFNTYGPRQSGRAVIPTIIAQALTSDELRLGALEPIRDFTFVTDTVEGFLQTGCCPEAVGQEVNIGNGACISIGDLVGKVLKLVGRNLPITSDPQRHRPEQSEVWHLHASYAKAAELIGWRPAVSLDQGLKLTIEWVRSNLARYLPNQNALRGGD